PRVATSRAKPRTPDPAEHAPAPSPPPQRPPQALRRSGGRCASRSPGGGMLACLGGVGIYNPGMASPARRILLINYEYPPIGGGGGNATFHIARAMAKLGHTPFVLTAGFHGLPRVEHADGVTVRRVFAFRQRT